MTYHFSTQAFMDRKQECVLVTFAPFRMFFCTANEVIDDVIYGKIKSPYILEGKNGDAAIGGIIKPQGKLRDFMFKQTVRLIENNRERGIRTGIIPALSIKARPDHGALLILVAHHPNSEHVAKQQSYGDYEKLLQEFFDGKPGFYC